MSSVLITGSSRGIGLALVKYLLNHADPPRLLIATCRNPEKATELKEIAKNNKRVAILQLDIDKIESFPDVCKKVEALVGDGGLNVLINNAGIVTAKIFQIADITPEDFTTTFKTNTVGPVFLTKAFIPLLEKAAQANKDKPLGVSRATVFFVSSFLGSIGANDRGGYWAYRESKVALNMSARTLAVELKPSNIVVSVLHPGHVKTDMGGDDAVLTIDESVSGLIKVIYSTDESKHGRFIRYDGSELPW